ncbi:MAG: TetR/AcrR family transcriptional regulator [Oscillospiraceae bacterium]
MSEREDLRIIKTRRVIKDALIELMSAKEVSAITITELSEKAMINRKTFYRHYRTVSDVVAELENEILSEFSDVLKSSRRSCLDLVGVIGEISSLIERRRDFFVKMMKLNPDLFNTGRIKAMLRRAFEVSLKSKGYITDPATLSFVSEFAVSGILGLYSEWFDNGCRGGLDFVSDIASRMIAQGISGFSDNDKTP